MKAVSIRSLAVAVSIFLTNLTLCSAEEARAKQLLTSFVSCQVSNTALDEAGISEKMLTDANSNVIVTMKVFSMLPDSNSVKIFTRPLILTMDGDPGPLKSNTYKIDSTASIKSNSLIELKLSWLKTDSNGPGVESVKTHMRLHSGEPAVVSCQRLNDCTLFLIVTSEILDPNKPIDNSNSQRVNVAVTRTRLKILNDAIVQFKRDTGRFPTEEEGLRALIMQPTGVQNYPKAGYLQPRQMPKDAWGHDFLYQLNPESGRPFVVISYGADGEPGGERANADLRSTDAE